MRILVSYSNIVTDTYNLSIQRYNFKLSVNYTYNMKKILSLLLILVPLLTSAQTRFTANSARIVTPYGPTEWQECNDTVTIDIDRNRLLIYSNPLQIIRLLEFNGKEVDEYGITRFEWLGIDQDNETCLITLAANASYIILIRTYEEMEFWYNLEPS